MKEKSNLIFGCILSVLGSLILLTFVGMKEDFKEAEAKFSKSLEVMSRSVNDLNQNISVITTDQTWFKKEMKTLEVKQHELETRVLTLEKR